MLPFTATDLGFLTRLPQFSTPRSSLQECRCSCTEEVAWKSIHSWPVRAQHREHPGLNGSLLATVVDRGAAAGLRRERQAAAAAAGAAALATTTASSAPARSRGSARPAPPATPPATSRSRPV